MTATGTNARTEPSAEALTELLKLTRSSPSLPAAPRSPGVRAFAITGKQATKIDCAYHIARVRELGF